MYKFPPLRFFSLAWTSAKVSADNNATRDKITMVVDGFLLKNSDAHISHADQLIDMFNNLGHNTTFEVEDYGSKITISNINAEQNQKFLEAYQHIKKQIEGTDFMQHFDYKAQPGKLVLTRKYKPKPRVIGSNNGTGFILVSETIPMSLNELKPKNDSLKGGVQEDGFVLVNAESTVGSNLGGGG